MHSIVEFLAQGLDHHRAGRLDLAVQCYQQALEADPNQADAWHLLGAAMHQLGDSRAAADRIGPCDCP